MTEWRSDGKDSVGEPEILTLLDILGHRSRDFSGQHAQMAANNIASQQFAFHTSLFEYAVEVAFGNRIHAQLSNDINYVKMTFIRQIVDTALYVTAIRGEHHVVGNSAGCPVVLFRALEERYKLKEARKLWEHTSWWARIAFYCSLMLLITILGGIPVTAFIYRFEIIDFLSIVEKQVIAGSSGNDSIATTVTAFGRLILISAPLGFVVWMIRLIVRYNVRSMLLMDDARARVTMLNTYLFLIERDEAVKQDRAAILEALFRRTPGHGSDTVEPPQFTDLLKYGHEAARPS